MPQEGFDVKKADRLHTPAQELDAFKSRINETMERVYGSSFEAQSAEVQHSVVKQALDEHMDAYVDQKFSNPFDKQKRAEKIILDLSPEEDDDKMSELLALVHEVGIIATLKLIDKTESYHIKDDFHRLLVQYLKEGYPVRALSEKDPINPGLRMTLFEVYIPEREREEDKHKDLKVLLSSMEQFYAGMRSVSDPRHPDDYFSVEVAYPQGRDEIIFYCAVPTDKAPLFRAQLVAVFPNIKIVVATNDYNIFNKREHIALSVAELKKSDLLPIKIYEDFNYDPLNILLESFSNLEKQEGAAIQIIMSPDQQRISDKIYSAIGDIEKGEDIERALDIREKSVFSKIGKEFGDALGSQSPEEREKEKEKKRERAGRSDRRVLIDELRKKNAGPIFKTNLRLVAAGNSDAHAASILSGLESAFNQFENTAGNRFEFNQLKGNDLRRAVQDFTFRVYNKKDLMHLSSKELTTLVHFHTKADRTTDLLKKSTHTTAGASQLVVSKAREHHDMRVPGKVLLGTNKHQGQEHKVFMGSKDRLRHMYVIGQTGTGKSILLQNMVIQDIMNGDGCCFIDPHGADIQEILANIPPERYNDVIYFDPADLQHPMGLNMLEYDPAMPEQKTFVVNELLSIFRRLYGSVPESMGPAFEQYFRNATILVMEDPATGNTMLEISRVLADPAFRALKLARCKNMVAKQFWEKIATQAGGEASLENIVPYITNKFDVFLANDYMRPIIAQEKSALNFRDIMDSKKILLVNLSKGRLGELNSNMLGLIIVGKILMAALSRDTTANPDLPPFYLYIDEFQNITTDSISQILSEARKYGLSLTVAHQFIKQLDEKIRDSVFGNVGSMITFRISSEDAEYLEKYLSPTVSARDIMGIENWNAYVKLLVDGQPQKPFNIATAAPFKGNPEVREMLRKASAERYGGNREEIEKMVANKFRY